MLLHSGARFGFKRTVPHLFGVSAGFSLMLFLCCIGVGGVLLHYPATQWVLKTAGFAYMMWLAYKLWRGGIVPQMDLDTPDEQEKRRTKPLSWWEAALFQYMNPNAWMMVLTVAGAYLPGGSSVWPQALLISIMVFIINTACIAVWARGGELLHHIIQRPTWAAWANRIIVAMTVYCAVSVWF